MVTRHGIKVAKEFESGMYFSCEMCGTCCRGLKEGEVFLYRDDIVRLANHLGLKGTKGLREFSRKYLKLIRDSFFWRAPGAKRGKRYKFDTLGFKFTGDDEHCHFLVDNTCTVHEARPFQCRAFPIGWKQLISSPSRVKDYSKRCPALQKSLERREGTLYSREELLQWAKKEYEMEKEYFLELKKHNFEIVKVYPFLPEEMVENAKKLP